MKDRETAMRDLRRVYRHPVMIQTYEATLNEWNEPVQTWKDWKQVWVSIEPISGREYWAKHQAQAEVSHRIRMRYIPGVLPTMRIVYGDRIFEIESVIDWEERNEYLQLMCKEVVQGGGG